MILKKRNIIDAVLSEPLYKGHWLFDNPEDYRDDRNVLRLPREAFTDDPGSCPVCAVGATLRKVGMAAGDITRYCDDFIGFEQADIKTSWYRDNILMFLDKGLYLSALYLFFEFGDWTTRDDLVRWVENNVPDSWEMEITK